MNDPVRVYVVVDWRRQQVYGFTSNVNQSRQWVRDLIGKYGDPPGEMVASQAVGLVDPDDQNIPLHHCTVCRGLIYWDRNGPGWRHQHQTAPHLAGAHPAVPDNGQPAGEPPVEART